MLSKLIKRLSSDIEKDTRVIEVDETDYKKLTKDILDKDNINTPDVLYSHDGIKCTIMINTTIPVEIKIKK